MTNDEFLRTALLEAQTAVALGAPIRPAAAAAHAANESAWGASRLTVDARNLFGLKAAGQITPWWDGSSLGLPTWEVIDGKNVTVKARFRSYPTWAASFADYGDVIRRVYPRAAAATSDVAFLAGIFLGPGPRWATDPAAFTKVCTILAQNSAILTPEADATSGYVGTLVLTNLPLAQRWLALTRGPAVLRGRYKWTLRPGKLDVRKL